MSTRLAFFFMILAAPLLSQPNPQDVQTLRGIIATSSYTVSDVDTINTTNGNVLLHIPIVSLPPARGGQTAGVSLVYNSTVYDSVVGNWMAVNQNNKCEQMTTLYPSEHGGWQMAVGYYLEITLRPDPGCGSLLGSWQTTSGPYSNYRYAMIFPDGSSHALIPVGQEGTIQDGYYPVDPSDGTIWWTQKILQVADPTNPIISKVSQGTHPLTFYTIDNTFARVQIQPGAKNWTMYFADGRTVANAPPSTGAPLSIITPTTMPTGAVNTLYSEGFAATGGSGAYSWSLASGTLPPGLTLSGSGFLFYGGLSGTPTQSSTYHFAVTVKDAAGNTATSSTMTLVVGAASSITIGTDCAQTLNTYNPVYLQLGALNGQGTETWSGTMPSGWTLSSTGTLTSTTPPAIPGTVTIPITVTDASNNTTSATIVYSIVDLQPAVQMLMDRNGNKVTINLAWNPQNQVGTATVVDDIGRQITVNSNWTVTATGGGASPLQWTVAQNTLQSTQTYAQQCCVTDPAAPLSLQLPAIPVVTSLTLPGALGGGSYSFDYNGTPGSAFTGTTSFTGELRTVTLPTGAQIAYTTSGSANLAFGSYQSLITNKTVSFGGQPEETWGYNITPAPTISTALSTGYSVVTAPDGGQTSEWYWNGLAVKTIAPDGSTTVRQWANNPTTAAQSPISGPAIPLVAGTYIYNPYVMTEYKGIAQGYNGPGQAPSCDSSACLTAITEYSQDQNGNALNVKEHDFVLYSNLTFSGNSTPQLPSGASGTILRQTFNSYAGVPIPANSPNSCLASTNSRLYCASTAPQTGKSILNTEVTDAASPNPNAVSYMEYGYDDGTGTGTANLTKTARWDNTKAAFPGTTYPSLISANAVITGTTYTPHGNVSTKTDANSVQTSYTYNYTCNGQTDLYPDTITVASNYPVVAETTTINNYDCATGVVTQQTNPNATVAANGYDAVGRLLSMSVNGTELFDRTIHDPAPSGGDQSVYTVSRTHLDSSNNKTVMQCFDPIYRLSRTQLLEPGASQVTCTQTVSGSAGIVTDRAYGYFSGGSYDFLSNPYRSGSDSTAGWTVTTQDTVGRTISVASYPGFTQPTPGSSTTSGAVTTAYTLDTANSRTRATVTDQYGVTRQSSSDRLGRMVQVLEGGSFTTTYVYDLLNDLTNVTQNPAQGTIARAFSYSTLGRLLTADNPETRYNSNVIRYTYDSNGNLLTRTDTRGTKTTSVYDALNRIVSKSYSSTGTTLQSPDPATITPSVVYCYDGNTTTNGTACPTSTPPAGFATGQLTAVSSSASTTTYSYNYLKQIQNSSQITGGTTYPPFSYTYDWAGALTSITYPNSNRVVNYPYDSANRTTGATSGSTTYASGIAFAPNNAIQSMNLSGTALTEATTYNSRFQPTQIVATQTSTGANLLTLNYSYCSNFTSNCTNNNGNVWQQQISFASLPAAANTTPSPAAAFSETQQYQYTDPANRLTQASAGSSWTQPFGYDSVGNRWVNTASLVGLATPGTETATASSWYNNTQNRIVGWTYDEMGNILQIGSAPTLSRVFQYDAENRQMQATINGNTPSSYVYDGDGRRVQANTSLGTTTFVYDAAGRLAQEYSTAPPTDSGTSYMFGDHLGSTRLITDVSGNIKKRFDYLPFGEELLSSTNGRADNQGYNDGGTVGLTDKQRLKFTSKERDSETGLDFFGARYFSSAQGRFTSADSPFADQHPADPQSWNLYAYVRNNPLKSIDVQGHYQELAIQAQQFLQKTANQSPPQIQLVVDTALVAATIVIGTVEAADFIRSLPDSTPSVSSGAPPSLDTTIRSGLSNIFAFPSTQGVDNSSLVMVGNNPRDANGRINTDLPGGHDAARGTFDTLTQGQGTRVDDKGQTVSDNGTRLRLNPDGTARVDIPKNAGTEQKHETVHFNDPDLPKIKVVPNQP